MPIVAVASIALLAWGLNHLLEVPMLRSLVATASGSLAATIMVAWTWLDAPEQPVLGAARACLAAAVAALASLA